MKILEDSSLSEIEKAQKLKERFEQLPVDWQQNLQELSKLDDLHTLTKQIKARNGSAEELRQMRTALVGAEATQRLETLDTQRNAWQQRVTGYLNQRDEVLNSSMSDSAKNQAIQQLRQQQFSSSQEQLRLQTLKKSMTKEVNYHLATRLFYSKVSQLLIQQQNKAAAHTK